MPPESDEAAETEMDAAASVADASRRVIERNEPRNFILLALYQIVHRVGWIFKTESIIMPAFLDYIGGTSWLRGCLPMLNRFGHSVPPVLFSRRLKVARYKKWALVGLTVGMALPFLGLSAIWFLVDGQSTAWLPWAFLVLYGLFFMAVGLNQMALHTLTGKLIRATRRGRLMTLANAVGAPASIAAALLLLGPWLAEADHGFGYIFGFTGVMFLSMVIFGGALMEPADDHEEDAVRPLQYFAAAYRVLRDDSSFRRLAVVTALFSTVLMLFPHYQALGRERLGLTLDSLLWWVVVQNAGTGLFSLLAGPIADRSGNRLVLKVIVFCCAIPPLLAVALAQLSPELGRQLYWVVFIPIGLTPVTMKVLANYTLEISSPADHPRYISTLSLCSAAPIVVFSPLLGLTVSLTSFEFVFALGAVVILLGGFLTWRLREPRHHVVDDVDDAGVTVED